VAEERSLKKKRRKMVMKVSRGKGLGKVVVRVIFQQETLSARSWYA
jgi:hypothetical protein